MLAVFLFHLGVGSASGGYVGVDIFFVISGFLITRIIADDIRAGRFSFLNFYNRRMKRILPVFQLVGLVTLLAGTLLLLPTSLLDLIKSVIASSLFSSNIFFWRATTGYFGASSDELPLLHNWSLSIEEQFYLLWPITLVLLLRTSAAKRAPLAIGAAIVATFALAQWLSGFKASAAYFLLPARAGEFLLGALLVFVPEGRRHSNAVIAQALGALGLVLVIVPIVLLDKYSRFPGLNAFWPCLGAALVIDAGQRDGTVVKSLLGFKPLVYLGTISYSLYLWHWPPIAFLHYFGLEPTGLQKWSLFGGVLFAADLSWRFVEEKTRRLDWRFTRTLLVFALLPLLIQVIAFAVVRSEPPAFHGLAEVVESPPECQQLGGNGFPAHCRLGDQSRAPTFVLWGDSFADALWQAVDEAGKREQVSGYRFIMQMCPSIAGSVWNDARRVPSAHFPLDCRNFTSRTLDFVLAQPEIQTVVLTSNYAWYQSAKNALGEPILAPTSQGSTVPDAFRAMLERLHAAGKRIVIVMPHTDDKEDFNSALRRAHVLGEIASLSLPTPPPDAISTMVESLALQFPIDRIYPHRIMCNADRCRVFDQDGDLYLSDGAHITGKTARQVVAQFPPGWHRRREASGSRP